MNTTMTDLIRKGLQSLYDSMPKEQSNALKSLASVKSDFAEKKTKKIVPDSVFAISQEISVFHVLCV